MATWEYKTVVQKYEQRLTEADLNQLGAQGFQLVNVFVVPETVTIVGRHETHEVVNYIFQREKPGAARPAVQQPSAPAAPRATPPQPRPPAPPQ